MEIEDKKISGQFRNLSASEFKKKLTELPDITLVDVRTLPEFQEGNIPGSINMDVTSHSFKEEVRQLPKNRTYFVYCRSGGRSAQACTFMAELGLNVYNLSCGISSWTGDVR